MRSLTHKLKQSVMAAGVLATCLTISTAVFLPASAKAAPATETYALICPTGTGTVASTGEVVCGKKMVVVAVGSKDSKDRYSSIVVTIDCRPHSTLAKTYKVGDKVSGFSCKGSTSPLVAGVPTTVGKGGSDCKAGPIYSTTDNKCIGNAKHCDPKTQVYDKVAGCITGSQATIQQAIQAASTSGDKGGPSPDPAFCAVNPNAEGCASNASAICDQNACDLVQKYVNPTLNILSVIFGLIAALSIIMGGIQYTTSAGDSQKTQAAKQRISRTIMAFMAYAFLYAFLQFLIPGGLFK